MTDHRLGRSWHDLPLIMEGEVVPVFEALRQAAQAQALEDAGS